MPSKTTRLTEAYGAIKSTLSKSWDKVPGSGALKRANNKGSWDDAGKSLKKSWDQSTGMQKAQVGGAAGAGVVGGAAAADFLNPWGLGWGD
jgi:hypothetical protein